MLSEYFIWGRDRLYSSQKAPVALKNFIWWGIKVKKFISPAQSNTLQKSANHLFLYFQGSPFGLSIFEHFPRIIVSVLYTPPHTPVDSTSKPNTSFWTTLDAGVQHPNHCHRLVLVLGLGVRQVYIYCGQQSWQPFHVESGLSLPESAESMDSSKESGPMCHMIIFCNFCFLESARLQRNRWGSVQSSIVSPFWAPLGFRLFFVHLVINPKTPDYDIFIAQRLEIQCTHDFCHVTHFSAFCDTLSQLVTQWQTGLRSSFSFLLNIPSVAISIIKWLYIPLSYHLIPFIDYIIMLIYLCHVIIYTSHLLTKVETWVAFIHLFILYLLIATSHCAI